MLFLIPLKVPANKLTFTMILNSDLRKKIAEVVHIGKEGHIPSSFSIIDIVAYLYENFLRYDPKDPEWDERDFFILSKGHGCTALYVVLNKHDMISNDELMRKTVRSSILGGHPDRTKIPHIEASTGSLGHGIGMAVGIALGLTIQKRSNRVICLVGDGESNEGTVWESALVASKYQLGNLCVIADHNGSSDLVLPIPNAFEKWTSFGWTAIEVDGHNVDQFGSVIQQISFSYPAKPNIIIARTKKGYGCAEMECNFGAWHARIPNSKEFIEICDELDRRGRGEL
jgi:transketolase